MVEEIWLIRHGETAWSATGQHTGRTDLPLTPRGVEEALEVRARLQGVEFDAVICSPLVRAVETCRIAGLLDRAEIVAEAMEWDYGDLNGRTRAEVRAEMPGWVIWEGPVPNGETLEEVAARAEFVLRKIRRAGRRVAVFAHGHFLRILTARWLGLPPASAKHFALATARVSVLGYDYGIPAIVRWNS
jgi:probable phosphoglycerate mutase